MTSAVSRVLGIPTRDQTPEHMTHTAMRSAVKQVRSARKEYEVVAAN
jgi:hypothetical protein